MRQPKTKSTKTIQEVAEDLILKATHDPLFIPCNNTANKMIASIEKGGFRNGNKLMTQVDKLMSHMTNIGPISQREAYLEYDIQSFHRRLSDIRQLGVKLKAVSKVNPVTGQDYTRYEIMV